MVVAAAVAMGIAWYRQRRRQRRMHAVRATASRMRLQATAADPSITFPFAVLSQGAGRGTENVYSGSLDDARVTLFDYWYYDEHRDADGDVQRSYTYHTCGIVPLDAACPALTIRPESLLTRAADVVGMRDIEVESEEFNRRFQLKSSDERFAFAFCDAAMIDWLLRLPPGYAVEVAGPWLLVRSNGYLPAAEWWTLLRLLRDTRTRVPSTVPSLYPLGR